ncbi:MAG: hypothetical protein K5856_03455, partial [Bacteroidaceae bacterium]|nr:hypothetical protein [Bacteroidaceae bacterium]
MKTIYNYRGILPLLLLVTVTLLYSCSKSDEPSNTPTPTPVTPSGKTTPTDPVTEYTMTVNATMGEDDATSRALVLDAVNNIINSTWTEGDEVKVFKNESLIGTLTAQELSNDNLSCVLKGTITGEVQNDDELTLQYRSNDFSSHNGTLADLAAKCDYSTA